MLAHRSAGSTVFFLLCSAGFTLSHSAHTARCEWHFCLYSMRFVRRHEVNQHPDGDKLHFRCSFFQDLHLLNFLRQTGIEAYCKE